MIFYYRKSRIALHKLIRLAGITLFGSAVIFTSQVTAEGIDTISSELLEQVGDQAFWEVEVNCEGDFSSVIIRQKLKQDNWCIESRQLDCQKTKQQMAEEVCLNIQILAKPVVTAQRKRDRRALASTSALNKQQLVLKEARLRLDKEKLEVVEIEAKLESRTRDIKRQLQALEN